MSIFSTTQMLDSLQPFFVRGRLIHVDLAAGNDTTGDGSQSHPYLTPARGVQDIRSDKNDVLIIDNNGATTITTPLSIAPMTFTSLNNFSVIGIGSPFLGIPTGRNLVTNITAWAFFTGSEVDITSSGAHKVQNDDYILVDQAAETGGMRANGWWKVTDNTLAANQFRVIRVAGMTVAANGQQPITGGAQGRFYVMNTVVEKCNNFFFAGINWAGSAVGRTGVIINGEDLLSPIGRNQRFYGCGFADSSLGLARMGGTEITINLGASGTNLRVENCIFATTSSSVFGQHDRACMIGYSGLNDLKVSECTFFAAPAFGTSDVGRPIRRYGSDNQKYGALFTANLFDNTDIPITDIYGTSRPALDVEPANNVFHRNFYTGWQFPVAQIISAGGKKDAAPSSFVNQDSVPSHQDLMWGSTFLDKTDTFTMGKLVVDNLDATVSSRATQADILSDATPFAGANVDATISSRASSAEIAALNNISVNDILTAVLASGESVDVALSRLDNMDVSVTTTIPNLIAALNDLSIVDVQTALTNQGYTAARAPNLDFLDALISSRAIAGDAMALTPTLTAVLEKIRKVLTNRVLVNGTDTLVTVYEDDDSTPAFTFTISGDRRDRTPV